MAKSKVTTNTNNKATTTTTAAAAAAAAAEVKKCIVCGTSILKPEPTWFVCKSCYFNHGIKKKEEEPKEEEGDFTNEMFSV